jgi:hypothetical protein
MVIRVLNVTNFKLRRITTFPTPEAEASTFKDPTGKNLAQEAILKMVEEFKLIKIISIII